MFSSIRKWIAFAPRYVGQFRESTASSLSRRFSSVGIPPDRIRGEHLDSLYRQLRVTSNQPDFRSIDDLLPERAEAHATRRDPVLGVIVEVRKHPALETVVRNFAEKAGVPIQLFHGRQNLDFILDSCIRRLVELGRVTLTPLDTDELGVARYNALLMSKRFWANMAGRGKILVFQTDTVFCGSPQCALRKFMVYDYIGSKWFRARPVGLVVNGGNGGLSLRDWHRSVQCLERFPAERWTGGEDSYFAFHIELSGGKVGQKGVCARFSTQFEFLYNSCGGHQVTNLSRSERRAFLDYCPDAAFMVKGAERP